MTRRARRRLARVAIVGAGKVGRALARALRAARVPVELVPRRELDSSRAGHRRVDLVVLAVRDAELGDVARVLAKRLSSPTCVVHTAGGMPVDVLEPLRRSGHAIGRAHPLAAFVSTERAPSLERTALVVEGDAEALRTTSILGRRIGMHVVRAHTAIDARLYHAAAALVANGAAALASLGSTLLEHAGIEPRRHGVMLSGLLGSVAENLLSGDPRHALSGPVRRGDREAIRGHLDALRRARPDAAALYRALVLAQLPIARAIGEASDESLRSIERELEANARELGANEPELAAGHKRPENASNREPVR